MRDYLRILIITVVMMLVVISKSVISQEMNLVQNSGFEDGLSYWDPFQYPSGWVISSIDPNEGNNNLRFDFPGGSGYYDATIRQTIEIESDVEYAISFWFKEEFTHDTYLSNKTILDAGIRINGDWYSFNVVSEPNSEWSKIEETTMSFSVSATSMAGVQPLSRSEGRPRPSKTRSKRALTSFLRPARVLDGSHLIRSMLILLSDTTYGHAARWNYCKLCANNPNPLSRYLIPQRTTVYGIRRAGRLPATMAETPLRRYQ